MSLRFSLLILIFFIPVIFNACMGSSTKNSSVSGVSDPNKSSPEVLSSNSEPNAELNCNQMVAGLENPDKVVREDVEKAVVANALRGRRAYDVISSCLIGELTESCSEDAMVSHDLAMISEGDFDRIRNIGETLFQIRDADAIPILIDCSDRTRAAGGLSRSNYPAVDPLLHFGDDAIPFLLKTFNDANPAKKCRIASILMLMRSSRASQSLRTLLEAEKNSTVRQCLIVCLKKGSRS